MLGNSPVTSLRRLEVSDVTCNGSDDLKDIGTMREKLVHYGYSTDELGAGRMLEPPHNSSRTSAASSIRMIIDDVNALNSMTEERMKGAFSLLQSAMNNDSLVLDAARRPERDVPIDVLSVGDALRGISARGSELDSEVKKMNAPDDSYRETVQADEVNEKRFHSPTSHGLYTES